jgi:hypothetical protein
MAVSEGVAEDVVVDVERHGENCCRWRRRCCCVE